MATEASVNSASLFDPVWNVVSSVWNENDVRTLYSVNLSNSINFQQLLWFW